MATLEDIGTDARSGDGYVVIFPYNKSYTGVSVVPENPPKVRSLQRLNRAVFSRDELSSRLEGFEVCMRSARKVGPPMICEIKFGVRSEGGDAIISLFLEFARQCNVITNPIVSDLRIFKLRFK